LTLPPGNITNELNERIPSWLQLQNYLLIGGDEISIPFKVTGVFHVDCGARAEEKQDPSLTKTCSKTYTKHNIATKNERYLLPIIICTIFHNVRHMTLVIIKLYTVTLISTHYKNL
jgi:hypothetical protein